ncbi:MAG: hypothetical protein RLZ26_2044, partial [Pseudomonadota bacterium]
MAKTPSAIRLYKGVSIYRVASSNNWYVRVWDRRSKKYIVKSTGMDSAIKAREVAQELALSLLKAERPVATEYRFQTFALKLLHKSRLQSTTGERSVGYMKSLHWAVQNEDWGLLAWFGEKDVRSIRTPTYQEYLANLSKRRPDISASTKNTLMSAFRNVMKIARDEGAIDIVPQTPRTKLKDNPRPFFRFYPLVPKEADVWKRVRDTCKRMVRDNVKVRGVPVTAEFYDVLLFLLHSFVRPIITELYAIRHSDITVATDPKRLVVTIRDGKTGYRASNTMPGAVHIYRRIRERYPNAKPEDYIFLPEYQNRTTAAKIIQRQFHALLEEADAENDIPTGKPHTLYSLRHTAICMRIINSEGKVNIYNLARNAGTSVDQIERFYTRYLP